MKYLSIKDIKYSVDGKAVEVFVLALFVHVNSFVKFDFETQAYIDYLNLLLSEVIIGSDKYESVSSKKSKIIKHFKGNIFPTFKSADVEHHVINVFDFGLIALKAKWEKSLIYYPSMKYALASLWFGFYYSSKDFNTFDKFESSVLSKLLEALKYYDSELIITFTSTPNLEINSFSSLYKE